MLLSREDAELFTRLFCSFMFSVNQRLRVVSGLSDAHAFVPLAAEDKFALREAFLKAGPIELIEAFVEKNPGQLTEDELAIVASWRHCVAGTFYMLRQLKNYMVFLSSDEPPVAYGVVALTEPFEDLFDPSLPRMVEAMLLPFKDKIIYDGLLGDFNVSFGGGTKRILNDQYRFAKERQGIVTTLPIEANEPRSAQSAKAKRTTRPKKEAAMKKTTGSQEVKRVLQEIVALTDAFCREHLNEEYATVCQRMAEKLSRKRPSPLLRGRPKTWACGIVRTVGWVNSLEDRRTHPYMELTDIDDALGVAHSTAQAKSTEIRKMLKTRRYDVEWTLPSMLDPRKWILEVDGVPIDARYAPREIQETAFAQGLIPYIPADHDGKPKKKPRTRARTRQPGTGARSDRIYQFKVTLKDLQPEIWRRIQVPDCTLDKLHEHIQAAMGWTNSHLYRFQIRGQRCGNPELLDCAFGDFDLIDSRETRITDIIPRNGRRFTFLYEYDFGDRWVHEVRYEGHVPREKDQQYPRCVEGERACPPEDIGGVWNYAWYLKVIADPCHEDHEAVLEWHGPFDPEAFDPKKATRAMRRGVPSWRC